MKAVLSVSRSLAVVALLLLVPVAWGADAGKVIFVKGTASAQKAGGTTRLLAVDSEVAAGDVITVEKNSVVRLKFPDGAQLTLKPETRVTIDAYHFEEEKPEDDSLAFSLVKGGLRAVSGAVGKRGNTEAYKASVTAATIGIRGTRFGLLLCAPGPDGTSDCQELIVSDDGSVTPKDGLYLDVEEGAIAVTNETGVQVFEKGAFGYVADVKTLPQRLPSDPGLKRALPKEQAAAPDLGGTGIAEGAVCEVQ